MPTSHDPTDDRTHPERANASTIRALAIPAEATTTTTRNVRTDLRGMQAAIGGGPLEAIVLDERGTAMYLDEEGKLKDLPPNVLATRVAKHYRPGFAAWDVICGDVIITGTGASGDTVDVSDDLVAQVTALTEGETR